MRNKGWEDQARQRRSSQHRHSKPPTHSLANTNSHKTNSSAYTKSHPPHSNASINTHTNDPTPCIADTRRRRERLGQQQHHATTSFHALVHNDPTRSSLDLQVQHEQPAIAGRGYDTRRVPQNGPWVGLRMLTAVLASGCGQARRDAGTQGRRDAHRQARRHTPPCTKTHTTPNMQRSKYTQRTPIAMQVGTRHATHEWTRLERYNRAQPQQGWRGGRGWRTWTGCRARPSSR